MESLRGKVIMIKNNKGGVGKTINTAFLGETAALNGKKVLILTTDSQNDILNYMISEKQVKENNLTISEIGNNFLGLKAEVQKRGTGDFYKLMDSLFFLPLENNTFGTEFLKRIPYFLEELRYEYDYIFIDSVPVIKTDKIFSDYCDYILVPTHATSVSIQHVLEFTENIPQEKLLGLIINQFSRTKIQKSYLELLESQPNVKILGIIPQLSFIEKILNNRKSIWEYQNKEIENIQTTLLQIFNLLETLPSSEIIEKRYKEEILKYLSSEQQPLFQEELDKKNVIEQGIYIRLVHNEMLNEKRRIEIEKQKMTYIKNYLSEMKFTEFNQKIEKMKDKRDRSMYISMTYGRLKQRYI